MSHNQYFDTLGPRLRVRSGVVGDVGSENVFKTASPRSWHRLPIFIRQSIRVSYDFKIAWPIADLTKIRLYDIMSSPIPQPPGVPLLGNIFDVDPNNTWVSLQKLADKYG